MKNIIQSNSVQEYPIKPIQLINKGKTRFINTENSAFELSKKLGKDNIFVQNADAFEA